MVFCGIIAYSKYVIIISTISVGKEFKDEIIYL